jgi:hypothetical protein
MYPPTRPMVITEPLSRNATNVEATTRGATSRWIGSMPSTSSASISSRIVRAPRSAQIAVEPAPATTSTVTIGPSCVTAPSAAPAPVTSAAPNSCSSRLSVKMTSTVSGMATARVGRNDTRTKNQPCWMNSRHWKGRSSALPVSTHMRAKPPTDASGGLA